MKYSILIVFLLTVVAMSFYAVFPDVLVAADPVVVSAFPKQQTIAVWDWAGPTERRVGLQGYMKKLQKDGFTTIYLSLHEYIDVYETPASATRTRKLKEYEQKLAAYVRVAKNKGMSVQALYGGPTWVNEINRYLPGLAIDYVSAFNSKYPLTQLTGVQFDIEPHGQADFELRKSELGVLYLETVQEIVTYMQKKNMSLALGFAIPVWYDGSNGYFPSVPFNGKSMTVAEHLFKVLDPYAGSYITLMDYRNKTDGPNGSIALAKEEFEILSNQNLSVQIIIGQETDNVEPNSITFYSLGKRSLYDASYKLVNAYDANPFFGGIAVHHASSYLLLKD